MFNGTEWTIYNTTNSEIPDNSVKDITVDKDNVKWMTFEVGKLAKLQDTIWTVYDTNNSGLPDNQIYCIAVDSNNNKWIATYNGIGVLLNTPASVDDKIIGNGLNLIIYPNPVFKCSENLL